MRRFTGWILLTALVLSTGLPSSGLATDGAELRAAFDKMYRPALNTSTTRGVDSLIIQHKDMDLVLAGGRLAFFEPIEIDSEDIFYAAYFEGAGQFLFRPPVDMEKEQLKRFFGTDSLNRSFDKALLLFTPEIYRQIIDAYPEPSGTLFMPTHAGDADDLYEDLTKDDYKGYIWDVLFNIQHPAQRPFLFVNVEPDNSDRLYYIYNPNSREEVRLLKRYSELALSFMETVCQYSEYIDPDYVNLNGLSKERIRADKYVINANIDEKADFSASAEYTFEVKIMPTQMLRLYLHSELKVDSVMDSTGQHVDFSRYTDKEEKSGSMYLFLDRPLSAGEMVTLKFFYAGEIIRREMGQCFVRAGGFWYPRYGYNQKALFTLNFKTPTKYTFCATGNLVSESESGDTLLTRWKVVPPTSHVSFNIGQLEKFTFDNPDVAPVEIYFSKELHEELGRELGYEMVPTGRNMQNQVAEDIINAMKLFTEFFGPYPYKNLKVGEILATHGQAFPGFLHLGYQTWINTDAWGYDRVFRAHEVAHQWWGVGVGWDTYHDQWLSEGFAEYSALMYLQAVAGNDKFLDRIKDYRNDIFSARKYLFGSGEESGPIALGYRTASTKTRGDYGLIIYKKAALVLHMLRNMLIDLKTMKEDSFTAMMKEFFGVNRGTDVCTRDFRQITEKYTGIDMDWFFDQWVYNSDLPTYEFSYDFVRDSAGTFTAQCRVKTTGVPDDFQMYVPLEIEIDSDSKAYIRILIDRPDLEFTLPGLPKRPRKLRLNPFESVLARVKQ